MTWITRSNANEPELCAPRPSSDRDIVVMLTHPAPLALAFVAAMAIAVAAWQLRSLTAGGAAAATLVGGTALSASWGCGFFLIGWFVLSSAVSRLGRRRKEARVLEVVQKGGRRDAFQVLANGGVFLVCVTALLPFLHVTTPGSTVAMYCAVAAAGSLAAAGADTWATEIGTWLGGNPLSIRSAGSVPAGTSGAVTVAGTLAMIGAAVAFALLAAALHVIPSDARSVIAVAAGGIAGATADTVIGAWLQERRLCTRCGMFTEQISHLCGGQTTYYSGVSGLNNDLVNAACASTGAAGALLLVLV